MVVQAAAVASARRSREIDNRTGRIIGLVLEDELCPSRLSAFPEGKVQAIQSVHPGYSS
jgi:hypothetical protein